MQYPQPTRITLGLICAAVLALSGCNLEIKVPTGGKVTSTDGAYVCEAGETCVITVSDIHFAQTFVAEPDHGYSFIGWRTRDGYLCAGSKEPCELSSAAFEDNPALESLLESDETFVLEPRFAVRLEYCPPELVVSPGPGFGH